ncbi:hypothetical protein CDV36_014091 [Fusarium kuroshium]|uniref:Zn(2)-C6 fungal-type domain-containing protein n=1 Tax=Fusarium kuroshium TaxID=2010991 RepID=A0A3M2RIU4_9HYPO|nr:hypothetical protein CDV36_014091 [Fusarium kuroshium]
MARFGHKKSRNGCSRCKQRKVKQCDERRPCGACTKRHLTCSLVLSPLSEYASPDDQVNPNPKSFMLPDKGISIAPRAEQPSSWTQDLGLMSHYSSITSATLPGANLHVWKMEIPSVAVAYPFLMHQILAVSAFHLASLNPSQGKAHLSRAFQHQHHAICGVRAEVSAVTARNCHALFAASSLLFIGAFAACSPARGRRSLRQEVDDMLGVFTLVRGVRSILNSFDGAIRDGILGDFMECNSHTGGTGLLTSLLQRLPRITENLDTKMDPVVKALAEEAIFALGESVGRASASSPELNVAIIWPMTLKDEFLDLIRARHPAALVVVAHYCTVLDAVGSKFWFLENWGYRLLTAIVEGLGPCWYESVRWPMDWVKYGAT